MTTSAAERFRRLQADTRANSTKLFSFFLSPRILLYATAVLIAIWLGLIYVFYHSSAYKYPAKQPGDSIERRPDQISTAAVTAIPFDKEGEVDARFTYLTFEERVRRNTQKIENLQKRKAAGQLLSDEELFTLSFSKLALTKSNVRGPFARHHCTLPGVVPPHDWSRKKEEELMSKLEGSNIISQVELKMHLERTKAQLLSLDHGLCTTKHAYPYLDSFLSSDYLVDLKKVQESLPLFSSYAFEDVCVTFNIDSTKRAQRGIIVFDDTNDHPERCSPCPNPQMNHDWGSNECGMMWVHQINVRNMRDYNVCYQENRDLIRQHGQRQVPGEKEIMAAIYYPSTTLLLQFVHFNPGHQLWDFLFSLLPILINRSFQDNIFQHSVAHQSPRCDSSLWACQILRKLGVFKTGEDSEENLIDVKDQILTCYEKLIVPIPGWNHNNQFLKPKALRLIRQKLYLAFDLPLNPISDAQSEMLASDLSSHKFLLYGHATEGEAGKRRAWINVNETYHEMMQKKMYVRHVSDFAALSIEEQAKLFHDSDIMIMSHGGQMGNSIFSRRNSVFVEITCGRYSHMAEGGGAFTEGLEFYHIVYTPCGCVDGQKDTSNYNLSFGEVYQLLRFVKRNLRYGSQRKICSNNDMS